MGANNYEFMEFVFYLFEFEKAYFTHHLLVWDVPLKVKSVELLVEGPVAVNTEVV